MNRRHKRTVNRDGAMIEEHKGPRIVDDESDMEAQADIALQMGNRRKGKEEVDFEQDEGESDYEDQLDSLRQAKRRKRDETTAKENRRIIKSTFLPSSSKKLSSCVTCHLVLNKEKWRKLGQCPNCPQSQGLCDTTENFSNVVGSVIPG